jgi:hypothetical protein
MVASKDDRARPKVAAMSRLSILAQGGSDGLGSATKEKAMKFEMITQDDLFTFKPLDDAAAAWMRKSPYADGGSAFITKKLYLRDSVLKALKEAGGSVVQVPTN